MSGILHGNCCKSCCNIPQTHIYEGVYQEELFNKTDAFLERLHELLKEVNIEVAIGSRFVLFEVIILIYP